MDEDIEATGFTVRDEANALTVLAFRNGFIEELHAGEHHPALDNPKYSRITDAEMKQLNIGISARLSQLIHLRDTNPEEYLRQLKFAWRYCRNWDRTWPLPEPMQSPSSRPQPPSD